MRRPRRFLAWQVAALADRDLASQGLLTSSLASAGATLPLSQARLASGMDETLVSDLVAIIRRFPAGSGRLLAARLEGQLGAPPAAELEELARRVHAHAATDEEVALSLAALLAASGAERP